MSVWRVPLGSSRPAVELLRLLRAEPLLVALLGDWADSRALIAFDPAYVADAHDDPFALLGGAGAGAGASACAGEDTRSAVEAAGAGEDARPTVEAAGAVGGGWFGYLGYQLGGALESLDSPPPAQRSLPAFHLAYHEHVLRLDGDGEWWFEALGTPGTRARLHDRLQRARRLLGAPVPEPRPYSLAAWRATPGIDSHAAAVSACRDRIVHGDLYQANLAVRLDSAVEGDLLDVFCRGVSELEPHKAAFIAAPWGGIASFSPELFLRRRGRTVLSAPIKGTRAERSRRARVALERSPKDRAENVMIVDLVRNDLGRVCEPGSIHVRSLARARCQTGVSHLVSEIAGRLPAGVDDAQLLRATFPPGSVTGAPKRAAQNVIAELESSARQLYTGAIGVRSPLAGLDLNVAIRTVESCDGALWMGVGGGVVVDSTPVGEAAEIRVKAEPVIDAIGGVLAGDPQAAALGAAAGAPARRPMVTAVPRRRGSVPVPRPDPAQGVLETMLVLDGAVPYLDAHLARLALSLRTLYGAALDAGVRERALEAAAGRRHGRLRLLARPAREDVRFELAFSALDGEQPVQPPVLETVVVPGGIGAHKWADRRLLDALAADTVERHALLVDLDGYVLESTRANLFAVMDGRLVTPPLDGRILPGTTRAAVIASACGAGLEVAERPLHRSQLRVAEELFVTSAVRRVVAVRRLDGVDLAPGDGLVARLHALDALSARPAPTGTGYPSP